MIGKGHQYKGNRVSPSQFLMMVILRRGPMYGYEVLKAMREDFKGVWEPQTGAIYPALKRLSEHGLVKTEAKDDKEYYSLTDEGAEWISGKLALMSREALFMLRYFEVINAASIEERERRGIKEDIEGEMPLRLRFMMGEEMDPKERLEHLRQVRTMMSRGLAEMEKTIARLEKEQKEG